MKIGFDAKRAFNNYTGLGNYSRFIIESLVQFVPENEYLLYTPKFPKTIPFQSTQVRFVVPVFYGKVCGEAC